MEPQDSGLSTQHLLLFVAVTVAVPGAVVAVRLPVSERLLVELVDDDAEDRDIAGAEAVADAAGALARGAAALDAKNHAVGLRADQHRIGNRIERRTVE